MAGPLASGPPATPAGGQDTIYLLHFSSPYRHARHYVGSTRGARIEQRLAEHQAGQGAVLTAHAARAGVTFAVARTWDGDRWTEARMKGHTPARPTGSRTSWRPRCPLCRANGKDD